MSEQALRRALLLAALLALLAAGGLVSWYSSGAQQEERFRAGVADVHGVEVLDHDAAAGKDVVELGPTATPADVEEVGTRLAEREELRDWQLRRGPARLDADDLEDPEGEAVAMLFLAAGRLERPDVERIRVEPLDAGARIRLRVSDGRAWVSAARALVALLRADEGAWLRPISVLDVAVSRSEATSDIDLSGVLDDPARLEALLAGLEPMSPVLTRFHADEDGLDLGVEVTTGAEVAPAWRKVRRAVGDAPATLEVRVGDRERLTSYTGEVRDDPTPAVRLAERLRQAGAAGVERMDADLAEVELTVVRAADIARLARVLERAGVLRMRVDRVPGGEPSDDASGQPLFEGGPAEALRRDWR